MSGTEPIPYMRLTSDVRPPAPRVRRGMTIDQVREIWLIRSETKTKALMAKYEKQRREAPSGYGREKFAIYGLYRQRAADAKRRLAVDLLEKAGLEVTPATIRKVTERR